MKVVYAAIGTLLGVGTIGLVLQFARTIATQALMEIVAWVAVISITAALTLMFFRSAMPTTGKPQQTAAEENGDAAPSSVMDAE
jgi:hypothetical protein